ncbi:hypothetical protein B0T21DRAFT_350573 [Apiosordaria backusii]|uniref:Uncharacterized protein n=1 Tax=Apiosordaria backusii TaxID=314023 RepID=A0AA40E460_9PEZI|nr:hypothetical protein B0T21DRAFT_350573 [Apiosordaria backusii]
MGPKTGHPVELSQGHARRTHQPEWTGHRGAGTGTEITAGQSKFRGKQLELTCRHARSREADASCAAKNRPHRYGFVDTTQACHTNLLLALGGFHSGAPEARGRCGILLDLGGGSCSERGTLLALMHRVRQQKNWRLREKIWSSRTLEVSTRRHTASLKLMSFRVPDACSLDEVSLRSTSAASHTNSARHAACSLLTGQRCIGGEGRKFVSVTFAHILFRAFAGWGGSLLWRSSASPSMLTPFVAALKEMSDAGVAPAGSRSFRDVVVVPLGGPLREHVRLGVFAFGPLARAFTSARERQVIPVSQLDESTTFDE